MVQAIRSTRSKPRAESAPLSSRFTQRGRCRVPAAATAAAQHRPRDLGVDPPAAGRPSGRRPRPGPWRPARRPPPTTPPVGSASSSSAARSGCQRDLQVDPVEQRTGEPAQVAAPGQRRALARGVAGRLRARARVGGEHQLHPGRVVGAAPGPGQADPAVLQRLAQRVQRAGAELGRLVEEQHAAMGQRERARPGQPGAAADQRRHGRGVVWRLERRPAEQPAVRRQQPRRSSAPRSPPARRRRPARGRIEGRRWASMVLPAPGGPNRARWCPPAAATSRARRPRSWPDHVGQVGPGAGRGAGDWPAGPSSGVAVADERDEPAAARRPPGPVTPGTRPASAALAAGTTTRRSPARAAASDHRQHAPDRPDRAVEAQLADERDPVQRPRAAARRRRRAAPAAMARSKAGAVFRQRRREQVDGDPAVGPGLAGVDDGGADPVAGLVERGVGQAGEGRGWAGRRRGRPRP